MTEITQADRDAAARSFASDHDVPMDCAVCKAILSGEEDDQEIVTRFARHRMEERAAIVALSAEYMGDIEFAQFKHALNADDQFLDPNHYWYRQGKDDGIEQERGNTVEWLKKRAPAALHDPRMVADAIEAGEHLK